MLFSHILLINKGMYLTNKACPFIKHYMSIKTIHVLYCHVRMTRFPNLFYTCTCHHFSIYHTLGGISFYLDFADVTNACMCVCVCVCVCWCLTLTKEKWIMRDYRYIQQYLRYIITIKIIDCNLLANLSHKVVSRTHRHWRHSNS